MVCMVVPFKLDYGNGLLGANKPSDLQMLNVFRIWVSSCYDVHQNMIMQHLSVYKLHWLPIEKRIAVSCLLMFTYVST